jgi:hypothetical protein
VIASGRDVLAWTAGATAASTLASLASPRVARAASPSGGRRASRVLVDDIARWIVATRHFN